MKKKDQVPEKAQRAKFYVEKESKWVHTAVILMVMSAVFRLIGCYNLFGDAYFAVSQIALPLACNLLFILLIMTLGKRLLCLTAVPVILGVVFFILKAFTFESWLHTVLCVLLYALVAVLYTATVFGFIRTKWLLVPLFALPFLYHIFVEDAAALRNNEMSFAEGMQEMSVLCIMLSLLCTAFAMKKKKEEVPVELPKIKDPKVIVPEKQTNTAPPVQSAAAPAQNTEAPAAETAAAECDTGDINENTEA